VNLVGRSAIKIFDVPKAKMGEVLSEAERELQDLADGIDLEDIMMLANEELDDEGDNKDKAEGWVDERSHLSEADRAELDKSIEPVRRVIVKASGTVLSWSCHRSRSLTASKTCVRDRPFDQHSLARLVQDTPEARYGSTQNASRRYYAVEFDFRHVAVRHRVPHGDR
jgi:hypothetical protein